MQDFIHRARAQILGIIFRHISKDDCAVFLFGSFAKNEIYPSSDIDIGILCGEPLNNSTLVEMKEEMEKVKTLRDIDIVDFTEVQDKDFLRTALREVKVWHKTQRSRAYFNSLKKLIAD